MFCWDSRSCAAPAAPSICFRRDALGRLSSLTMLLSRRGAAAGQSQLPAHSSLRGSGRQYRPRARRLCFVQHSIAAGNSHMRAQPCRHGLRCVVATQPFMACAGACVAYARTLPIYGPCAMRLWFSCRAFDRACIRTAIHLVFCDLQKTFARASPACKCYACCCCCGENSRRVARTI